LGVNWIQLAYDRDQWRAVVNAVMNLRVRPKVREISWPAERLLASQEGLYSIGLVTCLRKSASNTIPRLHTLHPRGGLPFRVAGG